MSSLFKRAATILCISTVLVAGSYSMYINRSKGHQALRISTGVALLKHNGKYKDKTQFGSSHYARLLPYIYEEPGVNTPFWKEKSKLFTSKTKPKLTKDSFFNDVTGKESELPEKLRLACKKAYETNTPSEFEWWNSVKWKEVNRYCTWWKGKINL